MLFLEGVQAGIEEFEKIVQDLKVKIKTDVQSHVD